MAENSKIEWTHHTWNLWHGCVRVHRGCDNCYAARLSKRWGNELWDKNQDGEYNPRMYVKAGWGKVKKWQNEFAGKGEYGRIFVGSMMDIFEKSMPVVDSNGNAMYLEGYEGYEGMKMETKHIRKKFFTEYVLNNPNLMFLLLTKRPSNILKMLPEDENWLLADELPRNVMFGASIVDNKSLKQVSRHLGIVNAVGGQTFWSIEPLLEKPDVNILFDIHPMNLPKWIIVGGESGPGRRPFNAHWARIIRDFCIRRGIAFFMKQMDKVEAIPDDLRIRQFPYWHDFTNSPQW